MYVLLRRLRLLLVPVLVLLLDYSYSVFVRVRVYSMYHVLYTVVVYNRNMKYLPADTVVGRAGDTTRVLYTATIVQ